jgi:L-alanine-DL-glutamate epimerase-like enolase superfamily enzyme
MAASAQWNRLWDIIGKALVQPVYRQLGGQCHPRLEA